MNAPARVGLGVGLPDAYVSAIEDPASVVRDAARDLLARWGVECDPDPEIRTGAPSLMLSIEGHETPAALATYMADRVTGTANAVALTAESPDAGWMLRTWVQLMLSADPALMLTDTLCRDLWARRASDPRASMPAWFPPFVKQLCSLGVPVPGATEIQALVVRSAADSPDPLHLAETVMGAELRPAELVASGSTFEALGRAVHAGRGDLEHQLIRALDTLGILTPAVSLARDRSAAPGTCEIRHGGLTLAVTPVPPDGFLLAMVSSDLLPGQGVVAPVSLGSPGTEWTLVRKDSPAEIEATHSFECNEADYLVVTLMQALVMSPERLPDRRGAERLLDDLFNHVGSGHTVWFTQEALSIDQVVLVLRGMLASDVPLNDLPALLRELLAVIDLRRPSHPDFVESFDRVLTSRNA